MTSKWWVITLMDHLLIKEQTLVSIGIFIYGVNTLSHSDLNCLQHINALGRNVNSYFELNISPYTGIHFWQFWEKHILHSLTKIYILISKDFKYLCYKSQLPGWKTSYASLQTTSETKADSAFVKNGTEATKARQLKKITS